VFEPVLGYNIIVTLYQADNSAKDDYDMQPLLSTREQQPTSDIALAAYLHSQGFELLHIDKKDFPTIFFFISSPELAHCVRLWEIGKAEGNLCQFYRSYKIMIEKIKDNGNVRRGAR